MKKPKVNLDNATIKIINEAKSTITSREVTYDEDRLSYGKREQLREQADMTKFVKYDLKKARSENKEDALESMDLEGMQKARTKVDIEVTKIVWGIVDLSVDNIVASTFTPLLEQVKAADLLDLDKEMEAAKKKREDLNTSQSKNLTSSQPTTQEELPVQSPETI